MMRLILREQYRFFLKTNTSSTYCFDYRFTTRMTVDECEAVSHLGKYMENGVRKLLNLTCVAVATLSAQAAFADGPFGVTPGAPISSLTVLEEVETYKYLVTVPKPHQEFELFIVKATPNAGICQINAAGKDHENDAYGTSVLTAFDTLKSQLESRYGVAQDNTFMRSGALWTEADEWVMSILQNERSQQFEWENVALPDADIGISEILLNVSALSSSTSYIALQYRFGNYTECEREINEASQNTL